MAWKSIQVYKKNSCPQKFTSTKIQLKLKTKFAELVGELSHMEGDDTKLSAPFKYHISVMSWSASGQDKTIKSDMALSCSKDCLF